MSAEAIYQSFELQGYQVLDSWTDKKGALQILIDLPRDRWRCKCCRSGHVHGDGRRVRFWKAAPVGLQPVWINMSVPRVKCLKCGKKSWHQPQFAEGKQRVTKKFRRFLEDQLSRLTIQDVVDSFGISWNTIRQIDLARLKKLSRPQLKSLKRIAIDEVYPGKKFGFLTLVIDLKTRAIVAVLKGRGKAALAPFFYKLKAAGAQIEAVATDMAGGYIAAVLEHLPDAKLVFDPKKKQQGHIVKLMNEKLSALRRELYHELTDKLHKTVTKGTRWLLVKNPENLKQTDKRDEQKLLQEALSLNSPLATAYYLKEDLRQFWSQGTKTKAEKFLQSWSNRANVTGIKQLLTMSKTLQSYRFGLLNWYDHPISTGPLEGINNKIGALQRKAYGYRNYEHFKERLLTLHHAKFKLAG